MDDKTVFQKRIFDFLMESQFWPKSAILDHQQGQLDQLLRFARKHVPFYQNRLDAVFTPSGGIDFRRWFDIPILRRSDLLNHRESMLATVMPPGHGDVKDVEGSGTTGKPVVTRHNVLTHTASQAALFRAHKWHKIDYGGVFVQWMGDAGDWPDGLAKGPWGPAWSQNADKGMFWQINRTTSPEHVAEFLLRKRADYFSGRPLTVHSALLAAERLGIKITLRGLSVFGSGVTEQQ